MKLTIAVILFLIGASQADAQIFRLNTDASKSIRDTLIAKTHPRDTTKWRPTDTTWGVGNRIVYDSIAVDTLGGLYNKVLVTVRDTAGNAADSVVFESWDANLRLWVQIGLFNLKTGTYVQVASAGDNTVTEYLLNDPAILYLRRRLVNVGDGWVANRKSLQALKLLNTY